MNLPGYLNSLGYIVQMKGEDFCDGVLGADILVSRSAVIDYKGRRLYLKQG